MHSENNEIYHLIQERFSQKKPFALYRYPQATTIQYITGKLESKKSVTLSEEKGFWFSPFLENEPALFLKKEEGFIYNHNIKRVEYNLFTLEESDDIRQGYIEKLDKIIALIKEERFEKLVLSRPIKIKMATDFLISFENMIGRYPQAFCYLFYSPPSGLWLGATPEVFLDYKNHQLSSFAVAGTQPKIDDKEPIWGQKELKEQSLVTDYISNIFKKYGTQVYISPTSTTQAGTLWHLKSKLDIPNFDSSNISALIKDLHPTPAVLGIPRILAYDYILKIEGYLRKYYTGFLGPMNLESENTLSLWVNLRCCEWFANQVILYVGGGITKDSIPVEEWRETQLKSNTILSILK